MNERNERELLQPRSAHTDSRLLLGDNITTHFSLFPLTLVFFRSFRSTLYVRYVTNN